MDGRLGARQTILGEALHVVGAAGRRDRPVAAERYRFRLAAVVYADAARRMQGTTAECRASRAGEWCLAVGGSATVGGAERVVSASDPALQREVRGDAGRFQVWLRAVADSVG